MKLYNLFEEIILEGLITEGVNTDQVVNAIDGEFANNGKKFIRRYRIHYDGDDVKDEFGNTTREGKGWRNIVPHAYGKLKNGGREVIRAYQVYGDSLRNEQNPEGWKLFRLDRITHWEPTNLKYWEPIEVAGQPTNMVGDNSMSEVFNIVDFESNDGGGTQNKPENQYFDTRANTYKYDNAKAEPVKSVEPEQPEEEEVEDNSIPTFDNKENGVGFDDEKIKNALGDESENEYEEEDIEDENDEIKEY
jgi:hypothetical protein